MKNKASKILFSNGEWPRRNILPVSSVDDYKNLSAQTQKSGKRIYIFVEPSYFAMKQKVFAINYGCVLFSSCTNNSLYFDLHTSMFFLFLE